MRLEPTDLTAGLLHLRPWRDDLVPGLVAVADDPVVGHWLAAHGGAQQRVTFETTAWADGSRAGFAVLEPTTAAVIGHVGLTALPSDPEAAEASCWVVSARQGGGVAGRALGVVCRWAFGTGGLVRVSLRTATTNLAMQRAAVRAGFVPEGVARLGLPAGAPGVGDARADAWLAGLLANDV